MHPETAVRENNAPMPGRATRNVPYVDFAAQYRSEREELLACCEAVFSRGDFVGGEAIDAFEEEAARLIGVRHVIAVASGTDALILGMRALGIGPGDEVITPPNSFVASTSSIIAVGAKPVFADVRADGNIDPAAVAAAVRPRTRAIMPVHLTGRVADMNPIMEIAEKHGLAVVEDAAQAIGSRYDDRMAGSFGQVGCFSAHPLKNVNAAGDAGFVATDDDGIAERLRLSRNLGLADRNTVTVWGGVSRMDTLQAAILSTRLQRLPRIIERRRGNAALYRERLTGAVFMPPCRPIEFNTFHTFVVQTDRRGELQAYLACRGVGTAIHYPIPIHLQPAASGLGYRRGDFPVCEAQAGCILTLPVHQYLSRDDLNYVADEILSFRAI